MSEAIRELIRKAAVINAIKHDGKAELQAVLGNLLGDSPELRSQARTLIPIVHDVVNEVNSTSIEKLRIGLGEVANRSIQGEKGRRETTATSSEHAEHYTTIITRLAPNPDFVLHLGNARAAVLSHDYARMYKGKFIVRFEDTDPRLKKAQLEYYEKIREDLRWLECEWDEEYIQSDRLTIYYGTAHTLVENGTGYVCECSPNSFEA